LENNDKVTDLYRLTVMWESITYSSDDFMLVKDDFIEKMMESYWPDSVDACNTEWDLLEKVVKAIKNINLLNEEAEKWIDEWKEAWQLLIWNRPEEAKKIEKEELKKYLAESWIPYENQKIINSNLEKYNQWWIDENNNFITNSIKTSFTKISEELKKWKKEIAQTFFEESWKINMSDPNSSISTNDLKKASWNSDISKTIQEDISKLYEAEVPFAAVWDTNVDKLRSKIVGTILNLNDSIDTLNIKTCKKAEKFCNTQDKWRWKCDCE